MNMEHESVIQVDLDKEMRKAYLEYSMSVIVGRALPDVRDGLKPVHRRILYTMFENNIGPDKAYRKCADTVGTVLGRYHPHGDASVYDALVRLAQDFSMRYPLVDGQGNFGSVDGDPPAAYRYTEARMSKISTEMLTDIEKDTVDFMPNYDDRLQEPEYLPSRFPNLLVNGSTGIAVGMATNIPPHNLCEVVDGMVYLIDHPDAKLEDLMEFIKGPDFPTQGIIMGRSGIRAAYATGRGKIQLRARTEIEEDKNGKSKIIVTELPYQVNKARLIESIADLVKEKKIEGISNIADHSDRNGMSVVIDIKRDASPQIVLNKLFSFTQLQITYGIIMLAIADGEPKILPLKDILEHYIKFQCGVITRRTVFELKKARERAHILEGLKIALDFIDEVIRILRASKNQNEGKTALMERFGLDDEQASAIVAMRLGQLTGMEREKIEAELAELRWKISDYEDILANEYRVLEIVKNEAIEIKKKYGDERKTEIVSISGEVDIEDLIPEESCIVTRTSFGYLKRQPVNAFSLQRRGGRGVAGMSRREEDVATEMFVLGSHDNMMFFTNFGRVYRLKCYEIPESGRNSKGMNVANLLELKPEEKVTSMIRVPEVEEEHYLVLVTKKGVIKRTPMEEFDSVRKSGIIAVDLDEGDELSWVRVTDGKSNLLVATKKGMCIAFDENDARAMGRTARGVRAIEMREDDEVVAMTVLEADRKVLTVSETGFGRLSPVEDYRTQTRGGKGLKNYDVEKYGDVAAVCMVDENEDDVILISSDGIIIRIRANEVRECARPSKGVKLMRVQDEDKVITVSHVPHEDEEEDSAEDFVGNAEESEEDEVLPEASEDSEE